ncbi:Cysteine protease atg4 [Tulasnella sp. 403]|nr:Cysteine protease atg4 [Tulasnella sp. 403]
MSPNAATSPPQPKISKIFHRQSRISEAPPSSYSGIPETLPPSSSSAASSSNNHHSTTKPRSLLRKSSKVQVTEKHKPTEDDQVDPDDVAALTDTPIIVEPPPFPIPEHPRGYSGSGRRSMTLERPLTMTFASYDSVQPSPTTARLSDISSRLSGWFSHSFAGSSSTDLPLVPSSHPPTSSSSVTVAPHPSPKHKASGIFNAARHPAKGLEKAVRYFLDSDAQPDKCTEPMWLMGVKHPGYEPPSPAQHGHRRDSTEASLNTRRSTPPTISRGAPGYHKNPSLQSLSLSLSGSNSNGKHALTWPPAFYEDFTSCIWMTYRSQYIPIRDITLSKLEASAEIDPASNPQNMASPPRKWWGGEKVWTSDAGWGCMIRTGQSLLANALIHLHLGRDWRKPPTPTMTNDYATYVKILTWFLDSPSTLCPFSVHRMVLAGKDLGTEVGCWFGPSIAAGAIKRLTHAFPEARLAVSLSSNNEVFESDVYTASHLDESPLTSKRNKWGSKAVLILVGIRLGIDGVNPIYYDGIKEVFTWPQCVGISGGRPSSSYYFVGEQAGSLFYLDPHHTRPAVSLRPPPHSTQIPSSPAATTHSQLEGLDSADDRVSTSMHGRRGTDSLTRQITPDHDPEQSMTIGKSSRIRSGSVRLKHRRPTGSPTSRGGSGSSNASFSMHIPVSPSPLSQGQPMNHGVSGGGPGTSPSGSSFSSLVPSNIDPMVYHYVAAYPQAELKTFHCDKVRKMPFSALDPSMLLGFLCRDEADWKDLRSRAYEFSRLHKPIFSIQDEPPSWSDTEDLESFSDPDPDPELEEGVDGDRGSDGLFEADDISAESSQDHRSWGPNHPIDRDASSIGHATDSNASNLVDDFEDDDISRSEPKRSSTFTNSTNASSKGMTNTDGSIHSLDDDDDWDSSVPSSSSPPAIGSSPKAVPGVASPIPGIPDVYPHSRSSTSASPPVAAAQFPFPRVPSPQSPQELSTRMPRPKNRDAYGMRSLKAKDGGRTPSGGVLAIFNPAQDD